MLGMEPTAKRRGLDRHCSAVEHNLKAGRYGVRDRETLTTLFIMEKLAAERTLSRPG